MRSFPLFLVILGLFLSSCAILNQKGEGPLNDFEKEYMNNEMGGVNKEKQISLLLKTMKLDVKKVVLDNGLTILMLENHHLPIFSYYTFFKIGSRHESKGFSGATHFLEHMMFEGAKKFGPHQFTSVIENYGGDSNAYTNTDSTVYYESLPIVGLETVMDLESDRMSNLLLEQDAFNKEKEIVLEERKMRYENTPRGKIYLEATSYMNRNTPYEESVIGKIEDIKAYEREKVLNYFKDYYTPNNAIIVIVGDINSDETLNLIKKYYGKIASSKKVEELKKKKDNPDLFAGKRKSYNQNILLKGNSRNPLFYLAYYGEPIGSKKSNELSLLSIILGSGESSHLNTKYVNGKKPLAISMGAFHSSLQYSGTFIVYGELIKGMGINEFRKIWDKDALKICDESINMRTLGKAKNQYLTSYFDELKTNSGLAHFLGLNEMYMGDFNYYKQEIEDIAKISLEDLKDTCTNMLEKTKANYFVLWDKN